MEFLSFLIIAFVGFSFLKHMKLLQEQQAHAISRGSMLTPLTPYQSQGQPISGNRYMPPPAAVSKQGIGKWVVALLCLVYIVFPVDFIPDVFPVIGWGDDLGAAVIGLKALLSKN